MDKTVTPTDAPKDAPENKADPKKPGDYSALGTAMKVASFPAAATAGFWVMDSTARGYIIEIETKASEVLKTAKAVYEKERNRLSRAVDDGFMNAAEARTQRAKNHEEWRSLLYGNLEKKGFKSFRNKFRHLRRVDQQHAIIEGMTVAGIILGAVFAITNSQFFHRRQDKDDGPSR